MSRGTLIKLNAGMLALLTAGLLASFRVSVQTPDSLYYAYQAKTGEKMYHPHHLLFVPAVHLLHRLLPLPVFSRDVIASGQVHNIAWAAAAVVAVFILARRLFASIPLALIVAWGLLFSQGFWLYATQFEVYVPALGALAWLLVVLIAPPSPRLSGLSLIGVSLLLAAAVFYHQTNVLFCLPLGYYLAATRGKAGCRAAAAVFLSAGLLVAAGYLVGFLRSGRPVTPPGFLRYCLAYAYAPDPDWGSWANVGPAGMGHLLRSQLWNLAELPPSSPPAAVVAGGISAALLVVWNLAVAVRRSPDRPIRVLLILWLLVYDAFFLWWLPVEREFFIIPLLPLLLLGGFFLSDLRSLLPHPPWLRRGLLLLAAVALGVLAGFNFSRSFLPLHRQTDTEAERARRLAAFVPKDCAIVTDSTGSSSLLYYCDRVLTLNMRDPLLYFYQSQPLPQRFSAYRRRCLFVPLEYVDPSHRVVRTDYDGYRRPEQWLAYMRWLLGCESDRGGRIVGCRSFQAVAIGPGELYLRIAAENRPVNGMEGLFRELDAEIARARGAEELIFRPWLAAAASGGVGLENR